MNTKKIIEDYLSGAIQYDEFIAEVDKCKDIINYLDEIYQERYREGIVDEAIYKHHPNFKAVYDWCLLCGGGFFTKSSLYDKVYELIHYKNNSLKYYTKYHDDFNLSLGCIPQYLDGDTSSVFIENEIMSKIPENLTKSQKIKFVKSECKRLFNIEGNKYPHWVQSCEWPIINNTPCKYLRSKRKGDMVEFIFEDPVTKNEIKVVQYY